MRLIRTRRLPIGLILLAGTALRLFRLGADSLWYDETVSVFLAGSPIPELLRHTAGDIHPPGYYLLLRTWLVLMKYPTGRAAPSGNGLEFAAGFFSLAAGVVLIALIYSLAHRVGGRSVALVAAGLAAFSPYGVWYSQEVRMYTLGAVFGTVALYALLAALRCTEAGDAWPYPRRAARWWMLYTLAAAAGMYTLYYFAFLLVAINLAVLAWLLVHKAGVRPWAMSQGAAVLLYAPWAPIAWHQATHPPVPPWRSVPDVAAALRESWTALSLGQSAPGWLWPSLVVALCICGLGLVALLTRGGRSSRNEPAALLLPVATFGSLALVLGASFVTPLYHVRYIFTYSPAFYVILALGLAWLWTQRRSLALAGGAVWLAAAAVTLYSFWTSPAYHTDDHRAAVRYLQSRWRPGDVAVVNAGYAYTALYTYWNGPIAWRSRLTEALPAPRADDALVIVDTGHVDGAPDLGWADPRSDFFAMPSRAAGQQISALFSSFGRVWHYRIYDTVNDPNGLVRSLLEQDGRLFEEQQFAGEANMRVQGFAPRQATFLPGENPAGDAAYAAGLTVQSAALPAQVTSGDSLSPVLLWQTRTPLAGSIATSLRLIDASGVIWAQPPDVRPLGPQYEAMAWPSRTAIRQPLALPVPAGTPPGTYSIELVVYDPASGRPWPPSTAGGSLAPDGNALQLGKVEVTRPATAPGPRPALARFGPLALLAAETPASTLSPGDALPVELLWQAESAPGEPLVIVLQLLDRQGNMAAGLEAQPLDGRYGTQDWTAGELVRDRHTLALPTGLAPGDYRLIAGVYRAGDRMRLNTPTGIFGSSQSYVVKTIVVH